jgi:hypothetical protein
MRMICVDSTAIALAAGSALHGLLLPLLRPARS